VGADIAGRDIAATAELDRAGAVDDAAGLRQVVDIE
jgi:hypothetical protein